MNYFSLFFRYSIFFLVFFLESSCIAISDLFFTSNLFQIENTTDRIATIFLVYIYLHESAIRLELFSTSNLFDALMDIVDSLKCHPDSRNVILMAGR